MSCSGTPWRRWRTGVVAMVVALSGAAVLPGLVPPATAAASFDPPAVGAGTLVDVALQVQNDGASPITKVVASFPVVQGLVVDPPVLKGWNVSTDQAGESRQLVTWLGGSIGGGAQLGFPVTVHVPTTVATISVAVAATHADGTVGQWTATEQVTGASTTSATTASKSASATTSSSGPSDGSTTEGATFHSLSYGQILLGLGAALVVAVLLRQRRTRR